LFFFVFYGGFATEPMIGSNANYANNSEDSGQFSEPKHSTLNAQRPEEQWNEPRISQMTRIL